MGLVRNCGSRLEDSFIFFTRYRDFWLEQSNGGYLDREVRGLGTLAC
jgi:hypothetical protein